MERASAAVVAGLLLALDRWCLVSADSAAGPTAWEPDTEFPCDAWYEEHDIAGDVIIEEPAATRDQCLPLCAELEGCTVMSFVERTLTCLCKNPTEAAMIPKTDLGTDVFRLCKSGEDKPPDCGMWMDNQDYFGSDVFDRRAESRDECLQHCVTTPNCNAVTYDTHVDPGICYMKNLLEGRLLDWRPAWPIASYRMCGDETVEEFTQGPMSIPLAALPLSYLDDYDSPEDVGGTGDSSLADDCTSSECEEAATQTVCDEDGCEDATETSRTLRPGIIAAIACGGALIVLLVAAWIIRLCCRSKRAQHKRQGQEKQPSSFGGSLLSSSESMSANRSLVHSNSLMLSHYRSSSNRNRGIASDSTSSSNCAVQLPNTMPLHRMKSLQSQRCNTWLPQKGDSATTRFTADSSICGSPHELHLSDYASTWHVPTLPLPTEGATKEDMMSFVHNQLDRMEASMDPRHNEIIEGLVIRGSGPRERLQGGQAIVQIVHSQVTRLEYAIKFFICRDSFDLEKALYTGDNPLGQFLPEVKHIIDNEDRRLVDPSGIVLPPCIVMEAGESLDLWSARNAPDRAQTFVVIYHIAQRLAELHAARYVHRDLKPGNVMWLPRRNRWTLIDFGCCALSGEQAQLGYTLRYAAPEVIEALRSGEECMVVRESQDAWSLGVMAFELATGAAAFPIGMDHQKIKDQIQGVNGAVLPWEGERLTERVKSQLRLFQEEVLQLLHRDPLQRPTLPQFCRNCSRMLGGESQ